MLVRTTKFPYFFWSFNRAYDCELNLESGIYKNLEKDTSYGLRKSNFWLFLGLKYLPIFLIFYFCFNRYDLGLAKSNILAYFLAFLLALSINFLDNLARKISSTIILLVALGVGFFVDNAFLVAYVIKYFLFFSVFLLLYLDMGLRPYSLLKNNKVVAHILIPKGVKI